MYFDRNLIKDDFDSFITDLFDADYGDYTLFEDCILNKNDNSRFLDKNIWSNSNIAFFKLDENLYKNIFLSIELFPFDSEDCYSPTLRHNAALNMERAFKNTINNMGLYIYAEFSKNNVIPFHDFFYPKALNFLDRLVSDMQLKEIMNALENAGYKDCRDFLLSDGLSYGPYPVFSECTIDEPLHYVLYDRRGRDNIENSVAFELYNDKPGYSEMLENGNPPYIDDSLDNISHLKAAVVLQRYDENDNLIINDKYEYASIYDFVAVAPKIFDYDFVSDCLKENPNMNPSKMISTGMQI